MRLKGLFTSRGGFSESVVFEVRWSLTLVVVYPCDIRELCHSVVTGRLPSRLFHFGRHQFRLVINSVSILEHVMENSQSLQPFLSIGPLAFWLS